jgi:hypothetical protein
MSFRKGSLRHVLAGKIFVASMLAMGVLAVYLAIVRHQTNNIGGGIVTVYLIGTGWLTARRRDGETSRFDWVVLLIPLTLGILTFDQWSDSRAQRGEFTRRSSGGNDFFHGFRDAAGCGRGRSNACTRRRFWGQAHRAASLAHVLWPVHRGRVFFPGAVKPPAEIAFGSGAWATLVPGSIQHAVVFNPQRSPTGYADFLASPSALQKCIPGIDTTHIRKSGFNAIIGRVQPSSPKFAIACHRLRAYYGLPFHNPVREVADNPGVNTIWHCFRQHLAIARVSAENR